LEAEETFNFKQDAKFNAVLAWLKARLLTQLSTQTLNQT
jgi:hypothetical protein